MTLSLSPARTKELDLWLYVRAHVMALAPRITVAKAQAYVSDRLAEWQAMHGVQADPNHMWVGWVSQYHDTKSWEWVAYLTHKGKTPKQVGELLGIKGTSVSVMLKQTNRYKENPNTLERWMKQHEIGDYMQSLWERTEIQELAIPPGDFSSVLQQSV